MLERETTRTDVLVIGSGMAAVAAAMEARKAGVEVTIVSKFSFGKQSSTAIGGSAFAISVEQELAQAAALPGYDAKPGRYLEDWSLIRTISEEAPKQCEHLIALGMPLIETSSGYRIEGGPNRVGGDVMLSKLSPIVKNMGISLIEGCTILSLLRREGRVVGASGLLRNGGWLSILAKVTVLATGGGAGAYQYASCSRSNVGDGLYLALKAGATLTNLEMVGWYAIGLLGPSLQHVRFGANLYALENARLVNSKGEDIIEKHYHIPLKLGSEIRSLRFEWMTQAVAAENEEGQVFLDLREVKPEVWERLPELSLKRLKSCLVNVREQLAPVVHVAQTTNGGILINEKGQTSLKGLYAAGEVASGHQSGDMGPNPMACCLALGAIAGRNAVAEAQGIGAPKEWEEPDGELEELKALSRREGKVQPEVVADQLRRLLYQYAGPIRNGPSLKAGVEKWQMIAKVAEGLRCRSLGELTAATQVRSMSLVGQGIMQTALLRTESRGRHYRRDFPTRDDEHWLRQVLVSYDKEDRQLKVEAGQPMHYGG